MRHTRATRPTDTTTLVFGLQDEVWNLVHHEGRYAGTASSAEGYSRFYRAVGDIVRRERAQTDLSSQTSADAPPRTEV